MAKIRQYELYDGEGETIPEEYAGPRKTSDAGKTAEDQQWEMIPEEKKPRYFARNESDDGLGAPSSLFDDFDRFNGNRSTRYVPPKPKKKKNQGAWTAVSVVCLLLLAGMCMLMVPQLTGIRHQYIPNIAFANGSFIELDLKAEEKLNAERSAVYTDRIYPGVYVDGVDVGGMTREEAVQAVEKVNEAVDTVFDLTVSIGNENWHINNDRVPITRNIQETVEKAWAVGRSGTETFRERAEQVSALKGSAVRFSTRPDFDRQKLRETVTGIAAYVHRDPVDSKIRSFDYNTKEFTFDDDVPGAEIDAEALYERLEGRMDDLLKGSVTHDTIRVQAERIEARYTKTELRNRCGLIAAFTTETTNNKNRNTNIELSAKAINGQAVEPGDIFSFNHATGERTAEKGYREAAAIAGGQTRDEIGGGVCQTSSTLFNAVARADLEIIERNPHAWPSNYIGKGFDATVNWPGLDFKFKNTSEFQVFIVAGYAKQKVTVSIYGMTLESGMEIDLESRVIQTYPKPTEVKHVLNTSLAVGETKKTVTAREGYKVETWKVWKRNGTKVKEELFFTTTYKPYNETIEYNDGSQP